MKIRNLLPSEFADQITVEVLKEHYQHLKGDWTNVRDEEDYARYRKAFRIVLDYYGEKVK